MTAATVPARARLGRYALWHLRDYLREKGIGTFITLFLLGSLSQIPLNRARGLGADSGVLDQVVDEAFVSALFWLSVLGALFATNGIIADDRRHGYYRLLFAKPVSVVRYYAQKFAVYGLGFTIVAGVLLAVYNLAIEHFFPAVLLPTVALIYIALGGIGFLLSAASRFDWLSLATVLFGSRVLWALFGQSESWPGKLVHALPPIHLLDGVYAAVRAGRALPTDDLVWLVGYGVACLALGLAVVRRRPLAT